MESSCKEIERMLVDYADDELLLSESSKVAAHLAECGNCRGILEALQRSLRLADAIWEDGLAETKDIHVPVRRGADKVHWPRYAAIAATIVFLAGGSLVWRSLTEPAKPELTFAEIERRITDSASAARLLAAAELLSKYPEAKAVVKKQYRYIAKTYPETLAGSEANSRIESLMKEI